MMHCHLEQYFTVLNYQITSENTFFPPYIFPLTGPLLRDKALYRSNIKDGLIVLQGLLLAVCIAAVLLHKRTMVRMRRKTCDKYLVSQTVLLFSEAVVGIRWN